MAALKRNGAGNSRQESTAGTTKVHVERLEGVGGGGAEVVGDKGKFLARWTSGCPVEDVHFCLANVDILFKLQLY